MIIMGFGSVLTTLRFCNKQKSEKLRYFSMFGLSFADMGALFVIITTLGMFYSNTGLMHEWKLEFTFWANAIAFVFMIVLQLLNGC